MLAKQRRYGALLGPGFREKIGAGRSTIFLIRRLAVNVRLYKYYVRQEGFDWQDLTRKPILPQCEIRDALFELDIRFGDISRNGPFEFLDQCSRSDTGIEPPHLLNNRRERG